MQCPTCGQHGQPRQRFCSACGTALAAPHSGGAPLPPTQRFGQAPLELVVSTPGKQEVSFPLGTGQTSIGRADTCAIKLDAPSVSREHAVIVEANGAYILRDKGSTNGLYVGGQRLAETPLEPGIVVRIPDPYGNVITLTVRPVLPGATSTPGAAPPVLDATRTIPLGPQGTALTFGRDPTNDVVIDLPLVSRRHALLERQGSQIVLRDLQSTNGTYVHGQRLTGPRPLSMGDQILIGPARFVFQGVTLRQFVERPHVRIDAVGLSRSTRPQGGAIILDNVSLSILPREFVALVGGSGAGKSTLLNALNGAAPAQTGTVLFNGQDFYRNPGPYSSMIGYVPQDDILHRDLPVERALDYAAQLRLPPDTSSAERAQRISEVLADMSLEPQRHQMINRLSGGQRKRVSIAVELLANPSVLFLDEPTSGLDPGLDKTVMRLLQHLCDKGQTVVLVTHATEHIGLCSLVAFVAGRGRLVYYGPPDEAPGHFGVPAFSDIYSYFDQQPTAVEVQQQRFAASPLHQLYVEQRQRQIGPAAPVSTPPARRSKRQMRTAAARQWRILTRRYGELLRRDRVNLTLLLAQAPIVGLLLALVASAQSFNPAQPFPTEQVLLMLTLAAIWFGTINAAREIVKERPIYLRERMVTVRIWPYVLSKFSVLCLLSLVQALILLWIVSLKTTHLPAQGILLPASVEIYVTLALTSLAGLAGGLLISSLVSSADRAMSIVPVILIAQVIFSGGVFNLAGPSSALALLSISRWCLAALGSTADLNTLAASLPVKPDDWPKMMYSSPDAGHLLGYWLVLAGFTGCFLLGTYASLRRKDSGA